MLLVISQRKNLASYVSESFHYMSILSYGATPKEALIEISDVYRAVLIVNPTELPDERSFVTRLREYKENIPIFALMLSDTVPTDPSIYDMTFDRAVFSPAIAASIIKFAKMNSYAHIGEYRLAGMDASSDRLGVTYFARSMNFTKTEAMIIRLLTVSYPSPRSSDEILKYAYRESRLPDRSSIRTHVSIINKKFYLQTKRKLINKVDNKGYVLTTPELISR